MENASDNIRYVLALESAMTGCSAALYDAQAGEAITKSSDAPRGQAEFLVPLVRDCVEEAGIDFQDIDLIATLRGPGSFTGLRVALSAARSFALALDIPLVGLETTDVLMRQYLHMYGSGRQDVCVLIETKRTDYYMQLFDGAGKAKSEVKALECDALNAAVDIENTVFLGDALGRFFVSRDRTPAREVMLERPDASILARAGFAQFEAGDCGQDVSPLYLRGADVSAPKNPLRKLKG